jgi:hypothetical protein
MENSGLWRFTRRKIREEVAVVDAPVDVDVPEVAREPASTKTFSRVYG